MLGSRTEKPKETQDRDALDAFRRYVDKHCSYESVKMTAIIQNGVVQTVKIYLGDRKIILKAGTEIK